MAVRPHETYVRALTFFPISSPSLQGSGYREGSGTTAPKKGKDIIKEELLKRAYSESSLTRRDKRSKLSSLHIAPLRDAIEAHRHCLAPLPLAVVLLYVYRRRPREIGKRGKPGDRNDWCPVKWVSVVPKLITWP
ncbi:hypothetical protein [Oryza sativa Japonica Group]|uniref:Uncharacterized protein n=1 Tax=Oryza sativa subsp. japonica TaxID=39947 RepID=Q5QLU5_ORYSJ|nr:hypothetical protein [Oryza sativa Japonica Group]